MEHRVTITGHLGKGFHGKVITHHNYGTKEKPDWYIEFIDDQYGYIYFKQSVDTRQGEEVKISFMWR